MTGPVSGRISHITNRLQPFQPNIYTSQLRNTIVTVSPFEVALVAVMERVVQQCEHNGVMIAQNNALLRKAVRKEVAGPASLPEGVVLPITSLAQLHAVDPWRPSSRSHKP